MNTYRHVDGAGVEWEIDRTTGLGIRITPLPTKSATRRTPATHKRFPVGDLGAAPDTGAMVLSFLTSEKPKSPEAAALLLLQSFPTLNAAMLMGALHTYFPKAGALR